MKKGYFHFDDYIISRMLGLSPDDAREYVEEDRNCAYGECLKRMGNARMISRSTLKKWFGIGEFRIPGREQLIQLFFALGLSGDEARDWMVHGAHEPDFQVNDFCEVLQLYCLENHYDWNMYTELIHKYLDRLPADLEIKQEGNTYSLWKGYEKNYHMQPDAFLDWMFSVKESFKGYSQTVYEYFTALKTELLKEVRLDAGKKLEILLAEAGLSNVKFADSGEFSPDAGQIRKVRRFLRDSRAGKRKAVSEDLAKCIEELLAMIQIPLNSNTELLAEMYAGISANEYYRKAGERSSSMHIMDDKYLSELMTIQMQKEKEIMLILHGHDAQELRRQHNRCRIINRGDLLPLILCVAQKRYIRQNREYVYDRKAARDLFSYLAVSILNACQMARFAPDKYELDHMLYECYAKDEMCSLAEMLNENMIGEKNDLSGV